MHEIYKGNPYFNFKVVEDRNSLLGLVVKSYTDFIISDITKLQGGQIGLLYCQLLGNFIIWYQFISLPSLSPNQYFAGMLSSNETLATIHPRKPVEKHLC